MTTINIPISDERLAQLRSLAEKSGLTAEQFLSLGVEQLLERPNQCFRDVAAQVLQKNAELYRRLA